MSHCRGFAGTKLIRGSGSTEWVRLKGLADAKNVAVGGVQLSLVLVSLQTKVTAVVLLLQRLASDQVGKVGSSLA